MTLGNRIRECRLKAKLSQEKVAELVGVSRQAVTKWEADQSTPNTDNLFKLAEILGTTVDFLITSEHDTRSIAEQVYQMFKDDERLREEARQLERSKNTRSAIFIAGGYFLIYLLCKLFWQNAETKSVMAWLFGTAPRDHVYLFGWLIHNHLYLFCSLLSIALAWFGKRRLAMVTLGGFAIGLPLGEYLGSIPGLVPDMYHMGWAIWGLIFIGSVGFGICLQRFDGEKLNIRSRKMQLWCIFAVVYIIAAIAFVLLNIPAAPA